MKRMYYFLALMVVLAGAPCVSHAQNDTTTNEEHPIFATTGPNLLGAGQIQWNNIVGWNYGRQPSPAVYTKDVMTMYDANINFFTYETHLRFGIGGVAEVIASFDAGINRNVVEDIGFEKTSKMIYPSVGVRVNLFKGTATLPKITFRSDIGFPVDKYWSMDNSVRRPETSMELQLRRRLGRRWALDGTLGYGWHHYGEDSHDGGFHWSLAATCLVTDRLALGVAWGRRLVHGLSSNYPLSDIAASMNLYYGNLTMMYQLNNNLQLSLQGSLSHGSDLDKPGVHTTFSSNLLLGVHWMLK